MRAYATLEDWELQQFSSRFTGTAAAAALTRPPLAVFRNPEHVVGVYALSTRDRPSRDQVVNDGFQIGRRAIHPGRAPTLVIKPQP
jgi:hypothetical protein